MDVYNAEGELIQSIECEAEDFREDSIPELMDINKDGFVDIFRPIDSYPQAYTHDVYLWNEAEQCYHSISCEEPLMHIEIEDGYIRNWIRDGAGYWVQELVFQGDSLVLQANEYVALDSAQ